MARIGYARVSTTDQDAQLQIDALKQAGVDKIFTDHGVSGTKASRPQLTEMLDYLRDGDTVVIWKFDRLGRSTRNMLELIETIEAKGCNFESITEQIDTTGPMGKAMLTIMSAFAQLERDQLAERTKAGLATARKHGRIGGRPQTTADSPIVRSVVSLKESGHSVPEIMDALKLGRSTVYKYLKLAEDSQAAA